jgi:hypothetical protein
MTDQERDALRYIYIREYLYLRSGEFDADIIKLFSMQSKEFDAEIDKQMDICPKGQWKKKVFHQCDEEGARQQYASRMEDV